MCNTDDWPLMHPPADISEEAAAQIAEFLMDFALWFESTHFSQIRRHHQAIRPQPPYDLRQLKLFESFDPF